MRIRWFAGAAEAVGCEEESIDPAALGDGSVVDALCVLHPEASPVILRCTFLADGRAVAREADFLTSWSTIDVLPPFAGG